MEIIASQAANTHRGRVRLAVVSGVRHILDSDLLRVCEFRWVSKDNKSVGHELAWFGSSMAGRSSSSRIASIRSSSCSTLSSTGDRS